MSTIATRGPGEIAAEWAEAWIAADQARLAELFTTDGTYTDLAVGKTLTGQAAITQFRTSSDTLIAEPAYRDREPVRRAGPDHDRVAVRRSLPGRADPVCGARNNHPADAGRPDHRQHRQLQPGDSPGAVRALPPMDARDQLTRYTHHPECNIKPKEHS